MEAELKQAALQQFSLISQIFRQAAERGATSLAIPAISAGKRGFPALLASAVTLAISATEVLSSGGTLDVYVVAYGDENHLDSMTYAKEQAMYKLVPG